MTDLTRDARLARTFVELSDSLVDDFDVVDLLTLLAERCVAILDATGGGVLLADGHEVLRVVAATTDALEVVELFQVQNDEGPCRDCYLSGAPVTADDLAGAAARGRWPRFASVALDAGLRSVHAFPLRLRRETLGALGLFGATAAPLAEDDAAMAQALADVATIAVLHQGAVRDRSTVADQLQHALDSRVVIEQAKGVLAERNGVNMGEAFELLRRHARSRGRLLAEVAGEVVAGRLRIGEVPSPRGSGGPTPPT